MIGNILTFSDRRVPAILYHTHENSLMGSLVRVFCTTEYDSSFIDEALARAPDFQCFFPVKGAVRKKILSVVGNRPPEGRWASFPLFKAEGLRLPGSTHGTWWLWDGVHEWKYEGKEEDISEYPERESVNDTMLISRIEKRCTDRLLGDA